MTEPGTARIAVDLLGGDHAPAVVVDGALRACQADPTLQLLLVGPLEAAESVRAALPADQRDRVRVLAAPAGPHHPADTLVEPPHHPADVSGTPIRPDASAAESSHRAADLRAAEFRDGAPAEDGRHMPGGLGRTRRHAEPGVRTAVLAVAQGLADAVVSAGDTGAIVTSAALSLGRLPGIRRPPLAAVLPTVAGRLVLLDVGSSVDPDAATLAVHARLGAAYAAAVHGVAAPRVGLLTIGTEPGKGDRLRRTAPELLAGLELPGDARYVGLVEGNDVVTGAAADVVVTDGFAGNVLLKGLETAYALLGPPTARGATSPSARGEMPPAESTARGETPSTARGETAPTESTARGEAPPSARGETPRSTRGETPPAESTARGEAPLADGPAPAPPPRAAVLLGVGGLVVVCHGAASGVDVAAGIALAASLHRRGTVPVVTGLFQGPEISRVQEVVHEQ